MTLTAHFGISAILAFALVLMGSFAGASTPRAESNYEIDFSGPTKARSSMPLFSIGSDRALIFLRPEHQRDLLTLQKDIGFQYLRCHGLFNEEMDIVSRNQDGTLRFDWTNVDKFIGQLRAANLKPFFELGFIPNEIASGTQTIFYWKGNVTPPEKMEEWSLLVSEFAKHILAKFGTNEVHSWYFEVWNEPNLDGFWTGGQQKYFELYAASARALKSVDPQLRVGGPSTAGLAWIPEFVKYCQDNSVPVDFVSSHDYAARQGFLDENGKGGGTVLDTNPGATVEGLTRARSQTPKELPLFITEWGPSYSPRDPIHDSYICAPFILEKTHACEDLVKGMSYWTFSDQFEEPGPPHTPFHGGFGLMNVDGLKKPAYFAYEILAKLYKTELKNTAPNLIATKKDDSLRFVVWNYSPPEQDVPNDPFYHRDLPPTDLGTATVNIKNLPNGTYHVNRFGIGYERNDVYDAFAKLKDPQTNGAHLLPTTLEQLKSSYSPQEKLDDIVVLHGTAKITLKMRTNDVWYLELTKS